VSDPTAAEVIDTYGVEEPAPRRLVKNRRGDWADDYWGEDDMWSNLVDDGLTNGRDAECLHCGIALFVYGDGDPQCRRCLEAWGEA
jgi:hypothetical protein